MAYSFSQSAQQPAAFSNSFGASTPQQAAVTAFPSSITTQAAPTAATGGLFSFGSSVPATTAPNFAAFGQPATASSFNFGAPSTTGPSFSFGSTTSATMTSAPSFTFAAPAQSLTSTSLFGQPSSAPAFQPFSFNQPSSQGANNLLASSTASNSFAASQPSFGSAPNPFGNATAQVPLQQSSPAAGGRAELTLQERLLAIQAAWHPQSPACRFQSFFYNVVDPAQAALYTRPPLARDDVWQRAKRENPEPERMVPALALSFDDVKKRVAAQNERAMAHFSKLQDIASQVKRRRNDRVEPALTRLQRASRAQVKLSARLLALIAQLHPFTPRKGTPLRADEESLANSLDRLDTEYAKGATRMPAMLNELWVEVASRRALAHVHASNGANENWEISNEEELEKLIEVVNQHQRSLDYLTKTLVEDLGHLNVIRAGFGLPRS